MDPITGAMLFSSVGVPLLGSIFGGGGDERARKLQEEALAEYLGISVPELRELAPHLLERTNLEGLTTDPRFDAAQDESLAHLQEIGRSGGLDAQARARLEEARLDAGTQARANREAVLANARMRGTAGTGEELTATLQADQASADRERMAGLSALSDAEERALQAIAGAGAMAGERQGRQWNQRAAVATAQDRIDEFNAATQNDFTMANEDQRWRQFNGQMDLAGARAGVHTGNAQQERERAERWRRMFGGVGQGLTYGLAGYQQQGMVGGGAAPKITTPSQAGTPAVQRTVAQQDPQLTTQQQRTRRKVA
jgi:hypothetical protein